MKLAILKERRAGEARVAATPDAVKRLKGLGLDVVVEAGQLGDWDKACGSDFDGVPLGLWCATIIEAHRIHVDGTGMHGMGTGEFAVVA